jgi:glycosyltransferase involved in cell wall biosynthesis
MSGSEQTQGEASNVFINGRFLSQALSGVQRYALEMTTHIDALIQSTPTLQRISWHLLVPHDAKYFPKLARIETRCVGPGSGHLWEQFALLRASAGGVLINFGNSAPLLHRRCIVIIHDAAVFRTPHNFSKTYVRAHRILTRLLGRTAIVGTVSEFSRGELAGILNLSKNAIFVARNGSDHLAKIVPDEAVIGKMGLAGRRYFLVVGTTARNKNVKVAIEAFKKADLASEILVIVGSLSKRVFTGTWGSVADDKVNNVIFAGRVSDEEVVMLFRNARAFVFPSLYEGFGIPPLEAMVNGCRVLASDIPPVREVCGDAATYFDPNDAESLASLLKAELAQPEGTLIESIQAGKSRAALFKWATGARQIASIASGLVNGRPLLDVDDKTE